MIITAWIISITASFLLVLSALAFLKAKDIFTMLPIIMAVNCYIIPLLIIAIEIEKISLVSLGKIIALIILNLIITNLLCHTIAKRALINKIIPDANNKIIN